MEKGRGGERVRGKTEDERRRQRKREGEKKGE